MFLCHGERCRETWIKLCSDNKCIRKDSSSPISVEADNLIEECIFIFEVISRILIPIEKNRSQINYLARYALYKIPKKTKLNPVYLMWEYLMEFLRKPNGWLSFGSLICTFLE